MATSTSKLTIRGTIIEDGETKSVSIATFNNLSASLVEEEFSTTAKVQAFLTKVQAVTSATITAFTITKSPVFDDEEIGSPGDPLESSEIFSEDYSDTSVTPTLNIINIDSSNKNKNFNVRYMADPVNTSNFNTKVNQLASAIGDLSNTDFVSANLTFSAKDEVARNTP